VFLLDPDAPTFDPASPFYKNQLNLSLWVNVYLNGNWGDIYNLPIQNEVMEAELPKDSLPLNA